MQGVVEYDISRVKGPLANTFLVLINALFFNVKLIGLYDVYPRDYSEQLMKDDDSTFDFIIVGGGAAGCAAAKQLSDQEIWSVLLLEAGDYPSPSTEVPGLYATFPRSKEDWFFRLEVDKRACQANMDKRCVVTKGKVLGGTSSINNLRYVRGIPDNYDKNECDMWSSKVTTSIFEKLESYAGEEELQYQYGKTGYINLYLVNTTGRPKSLLRDAYRGVGMMSMPRRKYLGLTEHLVMIKNGERFNMAKAFLSPIKDRPNLFFSKNTEVTGIVCTEPIDKRAVGVNATIDGKQYFFRARKEIILTAGAVNNVRLLLASGIGPSDYLKTRKITPVANLPAVGKNLQLHITIPMYVAIDPCEGCPKDYYRELDLIGDVSEYVIYRRGNLSTIGTKEFAAYISTKKVGYSQPDIGIYHTYYKISDAKLNMWMESMNYPSKLITSMRKFNSERAIIMFSVTLLQPLSRGEILLNETHHHSNPKIIPKFMTDKENMDFETLLRGFNFVTNLTEGQAMQNQHAELLNIDIPNCRNFKFCTRKYIECYIYNMAFTRNDAAGTTKMGPECDKHAVVKPDLEVKGIRCLRVADSSVMAELSMGNTIATDAMIGFQMGEILKRKWLKDYVSPHLPKSSEDQQ